MIRRVQVGLLALAGAAAAIPGMSALGEMEVPGGATHLFRFVLAAFSAAAVLVVFALRRPVLELSTGRVVRVAVLGMVAVLVLFIAHVWLTNKVLVLHHWRNQPDRQFVPLFLSDSAEALIRTAGSRYQLIMTSGPDVMLRFTTDTNLALTLATLLVSYTLLVSCLAGVFGVLGFRLLANEPADAGEPTAAPPPSGRASS